MLVKKRYVQHAIQGRTIPILFLSLVLFSLLSINVSGCYNCPSSPDNYGVSSLQNVQPQSDFIFSANSELPVGKIGLTWILRPDGDLRWYLYNAEGNIAYYKNVAEIHETEPGKGYVDDPDIRVPFNPQQGMWRLDLVVKGPYFGLIENVIFSYYFNVGESSLTDNIMAPIYLTWGGISGPLGLTHSGSFSWPLPGIFWLTSPVWILAIMFIMLAFYARSIRLAVALMKEGGKRFKEAIAGKS